MHRFILLSCLVILSNPLNADALSKKYADTLSVKAVKDKLLMQKQQEARVDMSQFNLNSMSAWRSGLKPPTTSNEGVEILPYRVVKSPS